MNKRKSKFEVFIFSSFALLASSVPMIDLEGSSLSALVGSLTIHATVLKNDLPDCQNSTCDAMNRAKWYQGRAATTLVVTQWPCPLVSITWQTQRRRLQRKLQLGWLKPYHLMPNPPPLKGYSSEPSRHRSWWRLTPHHRFYPQRIGNGLLLSKKLDAVVHLTGGVHKSSRSHRGNGFTLDLHPQSWCKRLPDHFDIGLVLLGSISIQVNAAVGQALKEGNTSMAPSSPPIMMTLQMCSCIATRLPRWRTSPLGSTAASMEWACRL